MALNQEYYGNKHPDNMIKNGTNFNGIDLKKNW